MIAVRPRTLLVLPRRAWRRIKTIAPKTDNIRVRGNRLGIIETFEKMLDCQVQIMLRNIEN